MANKKKEAADTGKSDSREAQTPPGETNSSEKTSSSTMESAGKAHLDQVRDILFGDQTREFNQNLARIDERLSQEAAADRDRVDAFELRVKNELQAVLDRVKAEQDARAEATQILGEQIKELGQEMKSLIAALGERLTKLDEKLTTFDRAQRQSLLEEVTGLRKDLESRHAEQSDALDREATALRDGKVDRAALGELLGEVAAQLMDQVSAPQKG